ncbi:DNA polymerase [Bacillaceae bacterium Marseille-Q3522]|nr:DNA polymerase [Bacillaceae bacterium Marseille-Q3522]
MRELSIDIETYSSVDLIDFGVYKYVDAPDFEILLFAYAFDDEPVRCIDLAQGEEIPAIVVKALQDKDIIKTAYNANFERTCLTKFFEKKGYKMDPMQWRCTSVHALTLGLPGYLDGVAKAMKLDVQKDAVGKALIKYFTVPCKPTKVNKGRTRNLPEHAPEKWQKFIDYCIQDVEVERAIKKKLIRYSPSEFENNLWALDQEINDRGVRLDLDFVKNAIECYDENQVKLIAEMKELTGLDNPNSVAQIKEWLKDKGLTVTSLAKDIVEKLIKETEDLEIKRVLELRKESSKTSIKKYVKMDGAVCSNQRVHGLLQFYGANRTGRWAGRLVQVQNLKRNYLKDLDLARRLVRNSEFELVDVLFGSIPDTLSQLIRTAFIPSRGYRFIVSDFSAIEARVIAWLAGEQWRLEVFRTHGKIYEASASQMFHVPIESIKKGSELRQKGKVAELALGYQGGPGALINMGALEDGLKEEELPDLVQVWRNASPKIVQFWYDVERAAIKAVKERRTVELHHGLAFIYESGMLFVRLPSGRRLAYVRPKLKPDDYGRNKLAYEGIPDKGQWGTLRTYGGKLVENIVQAIARDCLAISMVRLDEAGLKIVMHVHDEVILDVPVDQSSVDEVAEIMGRPIAWAPDLPLTADGYETDYYKKD